MTAATSQAAAAKPTLPASLGDGCLVHQTAQAWQIVVGDQQISVPSTADGADLVDAIRSARGDVSGGTVRCAIALAGTEFFFANLDANELGNLNDATAITYELERTFPLDAEAMVSDFATDRSAERCAAIALDASRFSSLIHALECGGIHVAGIVPASFLVARGVAQHQGVKTPFRLLLRIDDATEDLLVDSGGVTQWRVVTGDLESVGSEFPPTGYDAGEAVTVWSAGIDALPANWELEHHRCDETIDSYLVAGARLLLSGRWGKWPNLRRGALAPEDPLFEIASPLRWLALAAAFCLLTVSLAASVRSGRIAEQSSEIDRHMRQAYEAAYPGRRVPVMMMRSVRGEYRRALGSRGKGQTAELPVPATLVLRDLYAALDQAQRDSDVRFRLVDIDLTDGECSTTVRVQKAVQVGAIAGAMESVGFQVEPPASNQISPSKEEPIPTYESTINAKWQAADPSPSSPEETP